MIGASQIKTYMAPRISLSGQLFYQLSSLAPIFEFIWPSPSQMLSALKDPPRFSPWQELNWLPVSFRGWHLTRSRGIGEIMMDQTRIQIQDIRISCQVFYKLSYLATVIKLACHMPPLKRLEWSSLLKILTSGSFPGRSEPVSLRGGHSTNCY